MSVPAPLDITVIVLSFNEAIHVERCIGRIRDHVRRVVVVDSFSTDDTIARAQAMGAETLQNPFVNQAQQFNWALDAVQIDTAWVLRLDCDEYLDDEALRWLHRDMPRLSDDVAGVELRLKVIFKGKHLRFGGYYSTDLLRLWRTGKGRVEQRWMDERTTVSGKITRARGNLVDENLNSIGWWTDKHNRYASRHVIDFMMLQHSPDHQVATKGAMLPRRARFKRFLRNRIYARFPLFLRPALYWFYRYFVLLGFLDGKLGLIWHFLHGFWYYMLIDVKIHEARQIVADEGIDGLVLHYEKTLGVALARPMANG
ncbi:glycosyltransferase family 2 protein [Novosphingobium tardum]|uniref:Glycosyltransferase family 2 protein n=1 Tax=Novosphingobium tardum TaxID=1538021 RepID=A0ABV8RL60_9SPHN